MRWHTMLAVVVAGLLCCSAAGMVDGTGGTAGTVGEGAQRVCDRDVSVLEATYNRDVDGVPGFASGLVTNATVHGIVNGDPDREYTVFTGADGRVTEFREGLSGDPTLEVETDCGTVVRIVDAEDRSDAFVDAYDDGRIDVRGTDLSTSIVVGGLRFVVRVGRWLGVW